MKPHKRPEKPDREPRAKGAQAGKEGDGDGDHSGQKGADGEVRTAKHPEGKRRDGRRKLQAAVERADAPRSRGKPKRDRETGARDKGSREKGDHDKGDRANGARAKADRSKRGRRRKRRLRRRRDGRSADRRPSPRARARKGGRKGARALGSAARAVRPAAARLLVVPLAAATAGVALLFAALGRILAVVLRGWLVLRRPARVLANRVRATVNAAARIVTPKRTLALVVAGAAVLLILSQWVDYRSVSIGADAYAGLESIAPPPEVARAEAGEPHAYLLAPLGLICLAFLALALRGRPGALRLIAIAGVVAVLVALIVDRPAGLDISTASMSFEGVEASLLGGFYSEIAAGLVLTIASLLLAGVLRAGAPRRSGRSEGAAAKRGSGRDRRPIRSAEA